MRDLLYSIYVLLIIYCTVTIFYELCWDDPSNVTPVKGTALSTEDKPSVKVKMKYVPLETTPQATTWVIRT